MRFYDIEAFHDYDFLVQRLSKGEVFHLEYLFRGCFPYDDFREIGEMELGVVLPPIFWFAFELRFNLAIKNQIDYVLKGKTRFIDWDVQSNHDFNVSLTLTIQNSFYHIPSVRTLQIPLTAGAGLTLYADVEAYKEAMQKDDEFAFLDLLLDANEFKQFHRFVSTHIREDFDIHEQLSLLVLNVREVDELIMEIKTFCYVLEESIEAREEADLQHWLNQLNQKQLIECYSFSEKQARIEQLKKSLETLLE